jgi:hypothetical protein
MLRRLGELELLLSSCCIGCSVTWFISCDVTLNLSAACAWLLYWGIPGDSWQRSEFWLELLLRSSEDGTDMQCFQTVNGVA